MADPTRAVFPTLRPTDPFPSAGCSPLSLRHGLWLSWCLSSRFGLRRCAGGADRTVKEGLEAGDGVGRRRLEVCQVVSPPQKAVLALAKTVIGQQFVVDHVLVRTDERQHGADMLLIVVHARYERCPG